MALKDVIKYETYYDENGNASMRGFVEIKSSCFVKAEDLEGDLYDKTMTDARKKIENGIVTGLKHLASSVE